MLPDRITVFEPVSLDTGDIDEDKHILALQRVEIPAQPLEIDPDLLDTLVNGGIEDLQGPRTQDPIDLEAVAGLKPLQGVDQILINSS